MHIHPKWSPHYKIAFAEVPINKKIIHMQKRTIVYCFFNSKLENSDFLFSIFLFYHVCTVCLALCVQCWALEVLWERGQAQILPLWSSHWNSWIIQSSISFLTRKIHQVAVLSIQMFSIIPSIFFQRILIMNYTHTLFVFIYKSPNFQLGFKKPGSGGG